MDGDTKVTAAIVAAVVSLIGTIATLLTTRWQIKSKLDELTQSQFKDVIAKRIEVYPRLWYIVQTFTSDWQRARKQVNAGTNLFKKNGAQLVHGLGIHFKRFLQQLTANKILLCKPHLKARFRLWIDTNADVDDATMRMC